MRGANGDWIYRSGGALKSEAAASVGEEGVYPRGEVAWNIVRDEERAKGICVDIVETSFDVEEEGRWTEAASLEAFYFVCACCNGVRCG